MGHVTGCVSFVASWLLVTTAFGWSDQASEQAAIESAVTSYVEAFNARDAVKLAGHWGAEAVYTNPATGNQVVGREAIEQEFKAIFETLGDAKLSVSIVSIDFVSPNVALEQGTARLLSPEGEPEVSSYSAVHVKQNGKWLLDRVTEEEQVETHSHYEQLKELEWLVGTWLDESGDRSIRTTCQWTRNKNFLVRSFSIGDETTIDLSGMQFIGWDSAQKKIRSWAFDSDGGFAHGTWVKKDNRWIVNSITTLPGGETGSSINIMTIKDDHSFSWQATGREVGGRILPNVSEVTVTRLDDE